MQITFTISDNYVERLSKWASVQRTLSESKRLLERVSLAVDADAVDANIEELEQIGPALDHLHQMARQAIWEKQKSER